MNILLRAWRGVSARAKNLGNIGKPADRLFEDIYRRNRFGGSDSRSGSGSDLTQTATIRVTLPQLLSELGVRTMLDAPCGDFHWMREVELPLERYIGADIVASVIEENRKLYANDKREFVVCDISQQDLPEADLIFCRDCLVHLPNSVAQRVIANFVRSKARYLLTTTFPTSGSNRNIIMGEWRAINLQGAPFLLPPPARLLNENCTEVGGRFADKSLGLWLLDDLRRAN